MRAFRSIAVSLIAVPVLAACQAASQPGASAPSAGPNTGSSAGPNTGSSAGPSAAGTAKTTPPAASRPAGEAVGLCRKNALTIAAGAGGAASGHLSEVLVFTNHGTAPCKLHGYPGVAALDANGAQVVQADRTLNGYLGGVATGREVPTITLAAGQSASAMVESSAFKVADGSACTPWAGLLVTAPDDTESTRVASANSGCDALKVHPVVAGATGRSD